jgi:hypothetical protein
VPALWDLLPSCRRGRARSRGEVSSVADLSSARFARSLFYSLLGSAFSSPGLARPRILVLPGSVLFSPRRGSRLAPVQVRFSFFGRPPGCDSARSDFGFQQYRCWLLGFRFRARLLFPLSSFPARQLRAPVHSAARALASAKTFILASNFVPARLVSRSDLLSGAISFGPKACYRFSSAAGVDFSATAIFVFRSPTAGCVTGRSSLVFA